MKVSVSLDQRDVEYLDSLTESGQYPSRSAALAAAVQRLRYGDLVAQYAEADSEWDDSEDSLLWSNADADGL